MWFERLIYTLSAYFEWPHQIKMVIEKWGLYRVQGVYQSIAVFGMGGSGIVGDYLQVLSLYRGKYPVIVVKSHIVPSFVNKNTLSIIVSYSGNTRETLVTFKNLIERGLPVVTISSDGLLKELSLKYGIPHVDVPGGFLPRASLPSMLFSALSILSSGDYELVTREEAEKCAIFLEGNLDKAKKKATEISNWLYEKAILEKRLIVVATHSPLEALATRFKNEFNENSKVIVKVDVAPEWMHNDIVGYEAPNIDSYAVLEVIDPDNITGVKLVEFMESVYGEHDTVFQRINLEGRNILERLMYGSLVAGLASVLLAEKRGIDPATTKSITRYKDKASEIFVL